MELENLNHFDNERHQCGNYCEFFKNEIAICVRNLIVPSHALWRYHDQQEVCT